MPCRAGALWFRQHRNGGMTHRASTNSTVALGGADGRAASCKKDTSRFYALQTPSLFKRAKYGHTVDGTFCEFHFEKGRGLFEDTSRVGKMTQAWSKLVL